MIISFLLVSLASFLTKNKSNYCNTFLNFLSLVNIQKCPALIGSLRHAGKLRRNERLLGGFLTYFQCQRRLSKWDSATRFSTSDFLHGSVSSKPLIIPLGPFQILSKIRRDIRTSRCNTVVVFLTPVADVKNPLSIKFSLFLLDTFG